MTQTDFISLKKNLVLKSVAGIILLFTAISMSAQSLPDFTGVWLQDKNKSDFYKNFNVKCIITQTKESFNIKTIFSDSSNTQMVTRESTFTLDGKETTDSNGAKKSAKWSSDRKVLTTSDIKDYGGDLVGVTADYTISADKLVLTIKTSDIKPFVKTITQVFNKKK